ARHFALVEGSAITNQGPLVIRFRSGTQSDPCISSVTLSIMITTSNSPSEGERDTQSITRCLTSHHRDFQVVPRANRTFSPARNPIACASSSKGEPPVFVPSQPWRSSAPAASPGGNTFCAILGGCVL